MKLLRVFSLYVWGLCDWLCFRLQCTKNAIASADLPVGLTLFCFLLLMLFSQVFDEQLGEI